MFFRNLMIAIIPILLIGAIFGWLDSVTIAIASVTEVSFTTASVAWGTGYVTVGGTTCTLDTEGTTTGCTNFTEVNDPLVIENIGDNDVKLELNSSKNADDFIGGTGPTFRWKMTAGESESCANMTPQVNYTDVNTTNPGTTVCTTFYAYGADTLNIDLEVVIPSDAPAAEKTVTITATATGL
jgi:hypothetical protein